MKPLRSTDDTRWPATSMAFGRHRLSVEVFPWSLLRTPGLPAETLAPMADLAAMDAATRLLRDDPVKALAEGFEAVHLPNAYRAAAGDRADQARLTRARRTVARGGALGQAQLQTWLRHGDPEWTTRWQQAVDDQQSRAEHAERAYQDAMRTARSYLADRCSQPDVSHAVFLSGRDFFDNAFQRYVRPDAVGRGDTKSRQAFATAARYLRRMCVRCELTSFFGPVHFVRLDAAEPDAIRLDEPGAETVFVEPSVWLINELQQLVQRGTPLLHRRPRRNPLVTLVDGTLTRVLDGTTFEVSDAACALWHELDGDSSVEQACRLAGVELNQAKQLLRELAGTVIGAAELPAHLLSAFDHVVADDEPDGPARKVRQLIDWFAASPWPERARAFDETEQLVAGLGVQARRGKGEHYVDRYVLHEERAHRLSARTTLGRPVVAGLTSALADVLPLSFLAALLDREDARQAVRGALGSRPTRLIELLRADIPPVTTRGDAFRSALRERVLASTADGIAKLSRADVDDLITRFAPDLSTEDSYATLAGPDVMVLGDPAEAPWLLSELHDDGCYLGGGVTRLHPDGARVRDDLIAGVVRLVDPALMAPVVSRRRNMFLVPELPGTAIELSGRSEKPRDQTVPISEVFVEPDGSGVRVGDRRLWLYTGDIPSVVHRALALPSLTPVTIDCGEHTPRVQVGSTVVQRARWRVVTEEWSSGYLGWLALHELRLRLGLPRRVFARHPREQKPLYLDFADPYAVDDLVRLPPATVVFSEMAPTPDQLWWDDGGGAQCAELRTGCFVRLDLG
ncbi:MAG TPA: hypothetical protein VHY21_03810 [Pseudonocardiaceae bacterium]|nr:hypothetical protein [Pseudonocardiaceae bacterium]